MKKVSVTTYHQQTTPTTIEAKKHFDDHQASSAATQTHHIISAHIYSQRSLQLFGRRKKHGSGQHILWQRVVGMVAYSAHARWQQTWRLQTISTYFHPGSHGAHGARVEYNFLTNALTHTVCRMFQAVCAWQKPRCCCLANCRHRSFSPVCPPLKLFFRANSNFCLRIKSTRPPNTLTHVQKQNPHRFSATQPSRLCPVEMVLRSTMQYILYKTQIFI